MIFVDTAAFLARYLPRDQKHQASLRAWKQIEEGGDRLLTSNFVLDELFTLLGRRASYAFAAARAREILASRRLEILRPDAKIEISALEIFEKFADQQVSFTDCTSFALMRSLDVELAFTYDRHFSLAGFTIWPTGVARF